MNSKSTVKSLTALTMAGAMVFSMNTMPVSAAKKKTTSAVKSVKVTAPSGSKKSATVAKGKSIKLAVTVNATKKAYKKVTYKASNKKVISVSKKGVVKGKKAGTATVKVISTKNKKKTASIKIKVVSGAVKKVKLNKSKLALNVGDSGKLSAKVTASKKAYKTLKWTTSNKKVATVTSKGVVKGIGKGTAKITAASLDGTGKKSTCTVTVSEKQVVNGIKSMEVYNPLKSYSSSTLKVTLDSPKALTADDFKVAVKARSEGSYKKSLDIEDIYTTDNQTYKLYLESSVRVGEYVQITANALDGQKTVETRFLVDSDEVKDQCTGKVGEYVSEYIDPSATVGYSKSEIKTGTLPAGLKLQTDSDDDVVIKGTPSAVANNQHVTIATTDELGRVATTDMNFLIGDENNLVVENKTVGDQVSGKVYANKYFSEELYYAGGNGNATAKISDDTVKAYGDVFEINYYNDRYVQISAQSGKLAAGTYNVSIEVTDRKGIIGKGTLTVIVSPSAKVVTKVNNYNTRGTIYFYNHDTNTEVDLDDIEVQYERKNDTYQSTGYLPQGTYTVYYWMCGQKVTLYKTLAVNGDTNIEATLPIGKVTGALKDVNGNLYSGDDVYVRLYRSNDIELRRYSASASVDDGTYSIEGIPDGQYVLVVYGYDSDDKYFETTTGTITVSGGNVTMDVKLPVANPENPPQ